MPRLIFVAKGAMLDDGGECFRVLEELPAQAGGTRDSSAFAMQERAVRSSQSMDMGCHDDVCRRTRADDGWDHPLGDGPGIKPCHEPEPCSHVRGAACVRGRREAVTRPAACHAANLERAWDDPWERRLGRLASPGDLPMTADQPRPVSGLAQHAAGFTLLEVVIAIGILSTILVILFGTYTAVAERAARTRNISQIYHEARVLLRLMADDVRSAYVKTATSRATEARPRHKVV